jgi:hypothetical protein
MTPFRGSPVAALGVAVGLCVAGGPPSAGQWSPPVPAASPATIAYSSADGELSVTASRVGRRDLLEAVAREAAFRVLFAERLPNDPADYSVTDQALDAFVSTLLKDGGVDYVIAGRGQPHGGVRLVVLATPGSGEALAALREVEQEDRGAAFAEALAKDAALAREQERDESRKTEDDLDELERSLQMEGERVDPRVDPLAQPPVTFEVPGRPQPFVPSETPVVKPSQIPSSPLAAPAAPAWRQVTPAEVNAPVRRPPVGVKPPGPR